jgi:hypothetical protein
MSVTATIECMDGVTRKFWGEDYSQLVAVIKEKLAPAMPQDFLQWARSQREPFSAHTVHLAIGVPILTAHSRILRAHTSRHLKRVRRGWYRWVGTCQ